MVARLRPTLQALSPDARRDVIFAIVQSATDVAESGRNREEIAYHRGREDEAAGAPCPYCSDDEETGFELESNPTLH